MCSIKRNKIQIKLTQKLMMATVWGMYLTITKLCKGVTIKQTRGGGGIETRHAMIQ